MCERNLLTAQAWAHKETFREFWDSKDAASAATFFSQWFEQVDESTLSFVKKTATTLKEQLLGLLSYFVHRITNAAAEGLNSKIQSFKSNDRGSRSFANYRTRILFFCGKLDLTPA